MTVTPEQVKEYISATAEALKPLGEAAVQGGQIALSYAIEHAIWLGACQLGASILLMALGGLFIRQGYKDYDEFTSPLWIVPGTIIAAIGVPFLFCGIMRLGCPEWYAVQDLLKAVQ